ncbi:MAG: zinc-dependent peptidase [Kofleriaceae bacterium]|nr:zinc-dependent peptidase [Kofleriaceae bacterium]
MLGWLRRRRRRKLVAEPVPAAWHDILARNAPFVARLDDAHRAKLLADVQVLVAEKTFIGAAGFEITEEVKVTIAAAAARLITNLDITRYDDLTEIVVYPGAYKHEGQDGAVLGEAHSWGVVVLSWDAVIQGMGRPHDGHDTAVHEFAHVLDRADGAFDGAPALRAHEDYRPFATAMQRSYDRLRKRDRRLRKALRDYGATNEAEFFAVATEAYFEKPDELRERAPDLYDELRRFYGGPPG